MSEGHKIWRGKKKYNVLLLFLPNSGEEGSKCPLAPYFRRLCIGGGNHQGRQADSDFSSLQDNLGDNLWFSDISASSLMAL